jgi:peptidoglycan/xylan/chitin deacetylase (PgdA/CDA1 family)
MAIRSPDNRVYLTYDDGPDPEVTPQLLEILAQAGAKATFFVLGSGAPWWAEQIRAISDGGHTIGLHGLEHRSCLLRGNGSIHRDLILLREKVIEAGARCSNLWRPPHGHVRPDTWIFLKKRGILTVLWSAMPGDYRVKRPEILLDRATRRLRPGAIYALHDGVRLQPAPVLELTRRLLEVIANRGWQAAALSRTL